MNAMCTRWGVGRRQLDLTRKCAVGTSGDQSERVSQQTAAKERCSGPRPCSHSYVSCRSSLASYVGSGKAHCVITLCLCLLASSDRLTVHSTVLCSCFLPTAPRAYTAYTLRSNRVARTENRVYPSERVSTLTSCDVDHVPKSTRLSLRFSALGSKVMRIIIACGGGRAWERG